MKDILPPTVQAGVTFERRVSLAQYPAPGWQLKAFLRGPAQIDLTAAADGTAHLFGADAATSATWAAGVYSYVVRAINGTDVRQVEAGTLEIQADLATVTSALDGRSHAVIVLEAIEAVIAKRATLDQERYVIEGANGRRELWRTPLADLLKLRAQYRAEVRREQRGCGSGWGIAVKYRI